MLAYLFVVFAVLARMPFMPHLWNFTPASAQIGSNRRQTGSGQRRPRETNQPLLEAENVAESSGNRPRRLKA